MSIFGKLFGKKRKTSNTYSSSTYSSNAYSSNAYSSNTYSSPSAKPTYTPAVSYSEDLAFSHNSDGTVSLSGIGQCTDLEVTVPAKHDSGNVTEIGEKAFYENAKITDVTLPDSVKKICYSAFGYCIKLNTVNLGKGIEEIGDYAFVSCGELTGITLPKGCRLIGKSAFRDCGMLGADEVCLPNTLKWIEEDAFKYCDNLSEIIFNGTMEEWGLINKEKGWHGDVKFITVTCKDGEIDVDDEDWQMENGGEEDAPEEEEREKTDEELDAEVIAEFSPEDE